MNYTEKELKRKVMGKIVRDSADMDEDNYQTLKRCYKLLGGNEEDLIKMRLLTKIEKMLDELKGVI